MNGLEKLDEMVFRVIESVATGKDIKAEDIEYAARDLFPEHANLIISVIKNNPKFMELWGEEPDPKDMYLAVVESLPKDYTEEQFIEKAKELFPHDWKKILKK